MSLDLCREICKADQGRCGVSPSLSPLPDGVMSTR
jgi:hypothetical protein